MTRTSVPELGELLTSQLIFTAGMNESISHGGHAAPNTLLSKFGGSFRSTNLFLFWLESLPRLLDKVHCGHELTTRSFWSANGAKESIWAPLLSASRKERYMIYAGSASRTAQMRLYLLLCDTRFYTIRAC